MKNKTFTHFKLLFFLLLVLGVAVFTRISIYNAPTAIKTEAIENECSYCLNEPPCCAQIASEAQSKDATSLPDDQQPYHACDWPIRGYCKPSTCNQLPAGHKYRGNCGWYWMFHDANGNGYDLGTNTQKGYGCMIGMSESAMTPRCTVQGEITLAPSDAISPTEAVPSPEPTVVPTELPTQSPTEIPNPTPTTVQNIFPTSSPLVRPNFSSFPSQQQTATPPPNQTPHFSFTLPSVPLPHVNLNVSEINTATNKPLGLVDFVFYTIKGLDAHLEATINTTVERTWSRFFVR